MNARKNGDKAAARPLAKPAGKAATSSHPQLGLVRELARIATEYGLSEIELSPSGAVRLSRGGGGGSAAVHVPASSGPVTSLAPAPPSAAPAADEGGSFVTSPFVGTFYSAPSPEAGAFVTVGATVRKGQVVCIIEAMKLMNEIESELDGKVAEILVKNGEHVEYGQKLFRLAKA
jgi:acetyl-CoA carboxylase biotin carboxyl carrier protein